jgi:hypothetical protein
LLASGNTATETSEKILSATSCTIKHTYKTQHRNSRRHG